MVCTSLILLLLPLSQEESTLQKLAQEIPAVADKVRASVVKVQADDLTFSGIVYSKDGHVVTDASGVEHASLLNVTVGDRTYSAERLDGDKRTGVAVIKIAAKELHPVQFAPDTGKTGAPAIVVGKAMGRSGTLSFGTLGGLGHSILVRGRKYENMMLMSMNVLPGDCGACVADSQGRCVGLLHSAGGMENGDEKAAPPAAFAVPAAWVKFSADRIIKHGRMVRGWLGAGPMPLTDETRAQLGLDAGLGAEVSRVDRDSPAKRAGLAVHDILLSFDGQGVIDLEALQWKIAKIEEPVKVKLEFLRNRLRQNAETQIEIDPQK